MEINISKSSNYLVILNKICQQVFSIFLIGYLFFFLIDEIFDGFISNFIDLNYILVIVIIAGILTICLKRYDSKDDVKKIESKPWLNSVIGFFLGFIAMIVIFIKIYSLGILLGVIISILAGILIWLISYLFLND